MTNVQLDVRQRVRTLEVRTRLSTLWIFLLLNMIVEIDLGEVGVDEVRLSETMRLNERGGETVGLFDKERRRIVIKRDQLRDASRFLGTLLHELEHAASGHGDGTLEFEDALTASLGAGAHLLVAAVSSSPDGAGTAAA